MKEKKDPLGFMRDEPSAAPAEDEFSLESILAEFASAPAPKKPEPEQTPEPVKEPEPEIAPEPEPAAEPEQPSEPEPVVEPEPEPEPESEPESESETDEETRPIPKIVPIRREPRPVQNVSAEDLEVPTTVKQEDVIDKEVFDSAYNKKQKRIRKLHQQILSEDEAARKAEERLKKKKLKPAHVKTEPIPVPPAAKAEIEKERAEKPAGQRFLKRAHKDEQKKKPTLNPMTMLRKMERNLRSATIRFWLVLVLWLPLLYMTVAEYLKLPIEDVMQINVDPRMAALIQTGLLGVIIVLCYDIIARGLLGLFTLRLGNDTLTTASLFVSEAYSIAVALSPSLCSGVDGEIFAPMSVLPATAALFALLGSRKRYKTYRRSLKSCCRLQHARALTALPEKFDGDKVYAVADASDLQGFYQSFTENDMTATVLLWYAPLALAASLFLAIYCGYSADAKAPFLWCWSVIIGLVPALGFAMSAVLPLAKAAGRLYKDGVLLGGGKAVGRMADRAFVLMDDPDLFPGEAISINGYKLMDPDQKELAISCAASLMEAAHTSLARPFIKLAEENFTSLRPVSDLVFSDAGGFSGMIDGRQVLVGTASFVQRAWVKIPPDIKLRTAVFCVVDSQLLAIFAVKYQVTPKCDYALNLLEDHGYMPILATRDFNVTASFVQSRFGVASTDVVYPSADLRVALSDPALKLESDGLVFTYAGSDAVANSLIGSHRYKVAARLALIFSLISSVIGLGLGVLMAYYGWTEAATPVNMLLYYLLWTLPTLVFTGWVNRY